MYVHVHVPRAVFSLKKEKAVLGVYICLALIYLYIVMSCIMVRTELKGLTKKSSYAKLQVHQLLHYNVCSYDLHYNVLWGRYASELKGLMKKLLFSILPRKKDFHAKLQVRYSVCFLGRKKLQVHCCRVNEELCFVVLPGGSPISMHFMSTVYNIMVYLF